MRQESFLILSAVADEPRHGYGIIKLVEQMSGGAKKLRAGTLYAALSRFEDQGLLEIDREAVVDGRNRRYYRLTERGRHVLVGEIQQQTTELSAARRQLGMTGLGLT